MERIAMDILCELPETSGGNKHISVISNYYTKWTECFAMPNMEAKSVAQLLVEEVIVRFGTPYVIHTDQGVQFENNLFQVYRLLQIQLSSYYMEASFVSRTNNLLHITLHPFANLANNTPV
jgi:hypothetical protein